MQLEYQHTQKKSTITTPVSAPKIEATTISHVKVEQEIIAPAARRGKAPEAGPSGLRQDEKEQYLSLTSKVNVLFSAAAGDPVKMAAMHNLLNAALTQLADCDLGSNTDETAGGGPSAPASEPEQVAVPNAKTSEIIDESFQNTMVRLIGEMNVKKNKKDIWKNSLYRDLINLQCNDRGIVGEKWIGFVCRACGIDADCDGSKTKKIGGGDGDGTIMNIRVEIKTAHQGCNKSTFQHELGEVPWQGSEYMIFLDIAPEHMCLTIIKNFDEKTYKSKEKLPCFPTKRITWRKGKGAFKLDTTVQINERSVEKGLAIKITPTTSNDTIGSFIRKSLTVV